MLADRVKRDTMHFSHLAMEARCFFAPEGVHEHAAGTVLDYSFC